MIAQAKTIALHLGAIPEAMDEVLKRFGNDLKPGDAVILNDPYEGGMHLPDIFMFVPFFYNGELDGFCFVICHHTAMGGRVPGSNASDSTEIYKEGCCILALKLYDEVLVNETITHVIALNFRVPVCLLGAAKGQAAASHV